MLKKVDESLFLILNGNHHSVLDYLMLFASNLFSFIPVFLICIYVAVRYLLKNDDHYYTLINIGLIIVVIATQYFLCRYLLQDIFKSLLPRDRPCANPNISSYIKLLGTDCKPSAHSFFGYKTCLMFCISSFWFFTLNNKEFKFFKIVLILWSFLVAYSRIYVGAHYPLDVLLSASTGIMAGYVISGIYYYIKYDLLVI